MTATTSLPRAALSPTYRGFCAFCRTVDVDLAPFQRTIARAAFGPERETVAVIPRGSAKSTTAALLAVHHVLSTPNPSVYVGAGSREQARVIGRMVERLARHPAIAETGIVARHDELRVGLRETVLAVVPADGARAHGWERPTLLIGDELWMWSDREPTLLGAMLTSLVKNPDARFLGISTSAASMDSPLGRMRARALAQPEVTRDGAFIDAHGAGLRWLEWSVPDDADVDDPHAVKAANPAPWITAKMLAEQHARVSELEYLQFHCCRWAVQSARWLPPGAWQACRADYHVTDDEQLTLGVDVGGARSATALVGCVADDDGVRVAFVDVWQGREAVVKLTARVHELAQARRIRQIIYDPMRWESEALRVEREHGLRTVEWPQSELRMTRCSENLHRLVAEKRLRHPGDPELDRHVANAAAKPTPRGWRLVKSAEAAQIDAVIALAMAAEMSEKVPQPAKLLGWV